MPVSVIILFLSMPVLFSLFLILLANRMQKEIRSAQPVNTGGAEHDGFPTLAEPLTEGE